MPPELSNLIINAKRFSTLELRSHTIREGVFHIFSFHYYYENFISFRAFLRVAACDWKWSAKSLAFDYTFRFLRKRSAAERAQLLRSSLAAIWSGAPSDNTRVKHNWKCERERYEHRWIYDVDGVGRKSYQKNNFRSRFRKKVWLEIFDRKYIQRGDVTENL